MAKITSDDRNMKTASTVDFAASTDPRTGFAVSVERIIPVEYSPVTDRTDDAGEQHGELDGHDDGLDRLEVRMSRLWR